MTAKSEVTSSYEGFGSFKVHTDTIGVANTHPRFSQKRVITENVVSITSPLLKRAVDLYFGSRFASIPRALRIYHVIDWDAPIFDMCRLGDLEGVQTALTDSDISPLVRDADGATLLHVSSSHKFFLHACI